MELEQWVKSLIISRVEESADNTLKMNPPEKAWDTPLIGFSSAADPYYDFFKKDIGSFFWHPLEAFHIHYPDIMVSANQLTVISWVLPHTRITKDDHRKETRFPAERWARSRLYGESFNHELRQIIADELTRAGYPALSPMRMKEFKREDSIKYGYASSWSERHAAFVCGLGTFGLSDGLITPLGKAVRFGSVIAKIKLEPSKRSYRDHNQYCLFYMKGKCKKCIERCPADAISVNGHDKVKCRAYVREKASSYTKEHHHLEVTSCGLCQTRVPCESKIPKAKDIELCQES
ncbi:hypothetical protein KJ966_01985 [bacterium]|nr:hypothetical protein [bacterium]